MLPYYAYGRSDKKDQPRVPITARLIADMITRRRRRPRPDDGPAPGPDPGLLQHPGRRADGRPHAVALLHRQATSRTASSSPTWASPSGRGRSPSCSTRRWRSSRSAASGNLDRAELMNVIGEVQRQAGDHRRRRDRHRRHAHRDRPGARARGRHRDVRLRHARRAERPGDRADPRQLAARGRHHRHRAAGAGQAAGEDHALSVAPLIGEAIKRIHRGESVGALFSSEVSFTQEMLLWDEGADEHARQPGRRRRPDDGEPSIATARAAALRGRPMSLQLHRPDGEGGLEPQPVRARLAQPARARRAGAGLRGGRLPELKNPEMNPTIAARVDPVLAGPRRPRRSCCSSLGLRHAAFWTLPRRSARTPVAGGPPSRARRARLSTYTSRSHEVPFPFRRLERP